MEAIQRDVVALPRRVVGLALPSIGQDRELGLNGRLSQPLQVAEEGIHFGAIPQVEMAQLFLLHLQELDCLGWTGRSAQLQGVEFDQRLFQTLVVLSQQSEQVVKEA